MALKEISLPGGGRAWVRTRLSHERSSGYFAITAGLAQMLARADVLNKEAQAGVISPTSSADIRGIYETIGSAKTDIVGLCCHRWEDVRDPDSPDATLSFPDDVGKLDEDDFEALFQGCLDGVSEGKADPKGSPDPSAATST